jgi:hypothetical protein
MGINHSTSANARTAQHDAGSAAHFLGTHTYVARAGNSSGQFCRFQSVLE